MSFTPFIDLLVSLLCPHPQTSMDSSPSSQPHDQSMATRASSGSFACTSQPSRFSSQQHTSPPAQDSSESAAVPAGRATAKAGEVPGRRAEASPWQALFALHEHSTAYRGCLLRVLLGKDAQLISAAVRALTAVVQSKAASAHVLSSAGQSTPLFLCRCLHVCRCSTSVKCMVANKPLSKAPMTVAVLYFILDADSHLFAVIATWLCQNVFSAAYYKSCCYACGQLKL